MTCIRSRLRGARKTPGPSHHGLEIIGHVCKNKSQQRSAVRQLSTATVRHEAQDIGARKTPGLKSSQLLPHGKTSTRYMYIKNGASGLLAYSK